MSAVNAVQNAVKYGLKAVHSAPKAAATTISRDARPRARQHIDGDPSDPSIQRNHRNGCNPGEKAHQTSSHQPSNHHDRTTNTTTTTTSRPKFSNNTSNSKQHHPHRPTPLLTFIYEPHPRPLNCTTLTPTKMFISDPSHPLHIRTQRRLAAFDPNKLTWRVQVPVAVSKRPAIRREAEKRVKNAFRRELGEMGWGEDGEVLDVEGGNGQGMEGKVEGKVGGSGSGGKRLSGALLMIMNKDPVRSLTFKSEEVRDEVRRWVGRVLRERERGGRDDGRKNYMSRQNNGGIRRLSLKDGMLGGGSKLDQG